MLDTVLRPEYSFCHDPDRPQTNPTNLADLDVRQHHTMSDFMSILFSLVIGGLALRSVARTREWLKPENIANRPMFLDKSTSVPILVSIGFWVTLGSAAWLGWHYSGWAGLFLRPLEVTVASLFLDLVLERTLPLRLRYRLPLNPIAHLYIFPYVFLVGTVFIVFHQPPV